MELVFLGPPGAGKGTQAKLVSSHFGVPHLSTGDMLRKAVRNDTELGREAKSFMDAGALAPDDLIDRMVEVELADDSSKGGFLLDGYPRNLAQADVLAAIESKLGRALTRVVQIDVPDDQIEGRLAGRRSCRTDGCGAMYHVEYNQPSAEGVCDRCKGALVVRDDDQPEVVRGRLSVYHEHTEPLLAYYRDRNLLRTVNGVGSLENVHAAVLKAVEDN